MNFPKLFLIPFGILLIAGASAFGQCPSITVIGPSGVTNAGDEMKFRVEIGAVGPQLKYSWTVSDGTIVEGQGTSALRLITDSKSGVAIVTASVTIEGLPSQCEKSASETAPIAERLECGTPTDEWGKIKPNDERGRLDAIFAEMSNDPTNIGFFVLTITPKERLDATNRRVQFIKKHAKFREFDLSRILFALEIGDEERTKFFRIPPGSSAPCDNCLIIKGGDLH